MRFQGDVNPVLTELIEVRRPRSGVHDIPKIRSRDFHAAEVR